MQSRIAKRKVESEIRSGRVLSQSQQRASEASASVSSGALLVGSIENAPVKRCCPAYALTPRQARQSPRPRPAQVPAPARQAAGSPPPRPMQAGRPPRLRTIEPSVSPGEAVEARETIRLTALLDGGSSGSRLSLARRLDRRLCTVQWSTVSSRVEVQKRGNEGGKLNTHRRVPPSSYASSGGPSAPPRSSTCFCT